MNFESLETKHYIYIVLAVVVVYFLLRWKMRREKFSLIPLYPDIPPKYWEPRRRTHWSPYWYLENGYHPAVPKITRYDNSSFRLPNGSEHVINGLETRIEDISDA